ncbi:MAG: sulfatase [Acidobacteria bacterium]|nr:sulfatase [Acidobacteriota bacterium]
MTRRQLLASTALAPALRAQRRPNIVIILADDLGYNDLGFQGGKDVATPHLDALARAGTRYTNGYVSHPFCSPTRAGLMTGRYQQRFGHENNMVFSRRDEVAGLPLTEVTLPELLRRAGYATGLIGKWHLGAHPRFHPLKRGFSEMFGFIGGGHDYFNPGSKDNEEQILQPIEREDGSIVAEKEYLTTALGREAAAFVRRHKSDPFFLYLAFNAPHSPLQAPEAYLKRFASIPNKNRRTYVAMVAAMDDAIGETLKAIRESGLDNDTLIFFLSDNGGPDGNASSNKPLRATKRTVYEGGIRVPFAVKWTGKVEAGKVSSTPVISLDLFSTALAAAGVKPPKGRTIDGVDLLAAIPPRKLYWRAFGGDSFAVRDGKYKLVRTGKNPPELYDLDTDPGESRNLAGAQPGVLAELETAREKWNTTLVKPLWLDHIFHKDQLAKH